MAIKREKLPSTDLQLDLFIQRFSTGTWAEQMDPVNGQTKYTSGINAPLTHELVKKHLSGEATLAVRALSLADNKAKFLVIDFDMETLVAKNAVTDPDNKTAKQLYDQKLASMQPIIAEKIEQMITKLDLDRSNILVEFSGTKGYHLWLFFNVPLPAMKVYQFRGVLVRELGLHKIEIFPAQTSAGKSTPGSLIKIPMGFNRKSGKRCFFVDDSFKQTDDMWKSLEGTVPVDEAYIDKAVKLNAPEETIIEQEENNDEDLTTKGASLEKMIEGCAALKHLKEKSECPETDGGEINLTHHERLFILSLFVKFGQLGRATVHQFLENCHNYDKDLTDEKLTNAKISPMKCSTARGHGICEGDCQNILNCGGVSPIKLAMHKNRQYTNAIVLNSLAEIENTLTWNKRIRVDFATVSLIPGQFGSFSKVVFAPCDLASCPKYGKECACNTSSVQKTINIPPSSDIHVMAHTMPRAAVHKKLVELVPGCAARNNLRIQEKTDILVQPFACCNATGYSYEVNKKENEVENPIENSGGRESKNYIGYLLGCDLEVSKIYRGYGTAFPAPKDSKLVVVFEKIEPIYGQIDKFELTPKVKENLQLYKSLSLDDKLKDLTENVTFIHGRPGYLFGILLVYSSILEFAFNNTPNMKGTLDAMVVGDTGQAKSKTTERIVTSIGLGRLEDSNSSFAGLIGGVTEIGNERYINWGAFPRSNKGLIFIDEVQHLKGEIWTEIRTIRSTGRAKITKIVRGEHEAKVRLICAANADKDKYLADFRYGAQALSSFMQPADIRRFDFALFLGNKDLDRDYANEVNKKGTRIMSDDLLRDAFMWSWSRRPEHVHFGPGVTEEILKVAKELSSKYGFSADIPLCNGSDMREKLARMCVACAALHVRSEDFINITVTMDDVAIINKFLDDIYSNPNVALDMESNSKRRDTEIDEKEYNDIKAYASKKGYEKMFKVIEGFIDMPDVRSTDLMGWAETTADEMAKIISVLNGAHMILLGKWGSYNAKPKLIRFHKMLQREMKASGNGIGF